MYEFVNSKKYRIGPRYFFSLNVKKTDFTSAFVKFLSCGDASQYISVLSVEGCGDGPKCWVKNTRLLCLDVENSVLSSLISSGVKYVPKKNFLVGPKKLALLLQNLSQAFFVTVRDLWSKEFPVKGFELVSPCAELRNPERTSMSFVNCFQSKGGVRCFMHGFN